MKNKELEQGDRLLFNGRKHPVRVTDVGEQKIEVEGPEGGLYYLKSVNTGFIISSSPDFSYTRSVENMRLTGSWESSGDCHWVHSLTGREVEVQSLETGFWQVSTDLDFDGPRYGFTSKEEAVSAAKDLIENTPEG